jgi:hypothetical protein
MIFYFILHGVKFCIFDKLNDCKTAYLCKLMNYEILPQHLCQLCIRNSSLSSENYRASKLAKIVWYGTTYAKGPNFLLNFDFHVPGLLYEILDLEFYMGCCHRFHSLVCGVTFMWTSPN